MKKPKPLKIETVKAFGLLHIDGSLWPSAGSDEDGYYVPIQIIRNSDFRKLLSAARRAGVKVEVKS